MSVRPVSLVSFGTNYGINFSAKKKNNNKPNHIHIDNPVSHRLAIPLAATVLAMSPMSSAAGNNRLSDVEDTHRIELVEQNNNGRIVDQRRFWIHKNINIHYDVDFINTKDGSNNFDKVVVGADKGYPGWEVTKVIDNNYTLYSDDGVPAHKYNLKKMKILEYMGGMKDDNVDLIYPQEALNCINNSLNSTKNKSDIRQENNNVKLYHTVFGLQNGTCANRLKDAVSEGNFGKLAGEQDYEGDNGIYTIRYYSQDDNMDDAEVVTVQKKGFPELRLYSVSINNGIIENGPIENINIRYGAVTLVAGNKVYNLLDDSLTEMMIAVVRNEACKNAAKDIELYEQTPIKYASYRDNGYLDQVQEISVDE